MQSGRSISCMTRSAAEGYSTLSTWLTKLTGVAAESTACPPEDVGGPPGYVEFLNVISDPSHQEYEEMLEWCGGQSDPITFSIDDINEVLRGIKI